jgi:hypothetical protein
MAFNLAVYSTFCGTDSNAGCVVHPATTDYPCYMFSNNELFLERARSAGWIPVLLPQFMPPSEDATESAQQSKFAKTRPDLLAELQPYEFTLYTDTKLNLDQNLFHQCVYDLKVLGAPIGMREHWYLEHNIWYEFHEAIWQKRYEQQAAQMRDYILRRLKAPGFRASGDGVQLYATGVILRNMRHPDINRINAMWQADVDQCGIQCQISFFFVAQTIESVLMLPYNIDKLHNPPFFEVRHSDYVYRGRNKRLRNPDGTVPFPPPNKLPSAKFGDYVETEVASKA